MANRFIKAADLPPEFSIEKYSICRTWNAGLWAINLDRRIYRRREIESVLKNPEPKYASMLRDACLDVFKDPEIEWASDEDGRRMLSSGSKAYACRVRDVSCLEYLSAHEIFTNEAFAKYADAYRFLETLKIRFNADGTFERPTHWNDEATRDEIAAKKDACLKFLTDTPEWQIEPSDTAAERPEIPAFVQKYDDSSFAFATVDLNASDDELADDFRKWLRHARETRGVRAAAREFSLNDMQKWADMRVLAYIDLQSWLLLTEQKATNAVLGRVLFPDEFDIGLDDRVRKVVADYAADLMSPHVVRAMQSQYLKAERETQNSAPES